MACIESAQDGHNSRSISVFCIFFGVQLANLNVNSKNIDILLNEKHFFY